MAHAEPDPVSEADLARLNHDLDANDDRSDRQKAAIAMRIAGANYSEIAEVLSYSSANLARVAVERGLARTAGPEDREQLRWLEARRLERILRGLWKKATMDEIDGERNEEHLPAARTALAVIDRHAKLYGLDAPTEMVVYNPTGGEIQAWVERLTSQVREAFPEEADIIEGELTEGNQNL